MCSKGHDFATSMVNGRLRTMFKNSFVWRIDHEISGHKHQGRMYHSLLFHDWRLCSIKKYFFLGQVDFESARVAQLNAERLSARNWRHQDWVKDQAADHPLSATSGEYYRLLYGKPSLRQIPVPRAKCVHRPLSLADIADNSHYVRNVTVLNPFPSL